MKRWLEVVSHLDPKYGGLSAAVPALASAVADAGRRPVSVAAFCAPSERFVPSVGPSVDVNYLPLGRVAFGRERGAGEQFRALAAGSAALHIHGLWEHSTAHAAHTARQLGKPYMVSAHGMLERWALSQKRFKKALYAALVERPLLRRAACLHALTEAEADDYRRFGLRNPIAVIPNGVSVRPAVTPEIFLERFPELRGRRLLLFLGRLHPKKGLHLLCEAWSELEGRWPEAHLVLAGPDGGGNTQAALEGRCAALGVKRVTFTGMLAGDMKWSALRAATVFVLPSYSEGLSVSVLEAMGMGVPVVVTRQCNLPVVSSHGCGWEIEPERGELRGALAEVLAAPAARLAQCGVQGAEVVGSRYSWERVGRQMADVYGWMAGGAKPSGVFSGEESGEDGRKPGEPGQRAVWEAARKGASA